MKKILIFFVIVILGSTNALKASGNLADGGKSKLDLFRTSKELATDDPVEIAPDNDPKSTWYEDKIIYDGSVNVNAWAVAQGIDDDAIDVDYFAGDTLRAVVACSDSMVRIFRSDDNGQTWVYANGFQFLYDNATEPHIVHGPDSTYHVLVRYLKDQDQLYARTYRTADESVISGSDQYISGTDSVKNYTVCTNRQGFHDYSVFVAYHNGLGGAGADQIKFTRTTDQGQNWTAPDGLQYAGSGFPDLVYGGDSTLHETYLAILSDTTYRINTRRSYDLGNSWEGSIHLESDTFPKMGPQIAAGYNEGGDVWVIWSKQNLLNANDDWGLRWSWSTDSGATWPNPAWINSNIDSNEVLPSIAVHDAFGSTSNTPYVTFIKSFYDYTGEISVRSFEWQNADSSWSADSCYADSGAVVTRPIQTFIASGIPAIAYVGANADKVYFDSWSNSSGIEEDNDITASDGQIKCSLDQNIIMGTAVLKYTLPIETTVNVSLVNILGQKIEILDNGEKAGGEHTVSVSAENLSQGIYYIVIETKNGEKGITKATVLK